LQDVDFVGIIRAVAASLDVGSYKRGPPQEECPLEPTDLEVTLGRQLTSVPWDRPQNPSSDSEDDDADSNHGHSDSLGALSSSSDDDDELIEEGDADLDETYEESLWREHALHYDFSSRRRMRTRGDALRKKLAERVSRKTARRAKVYKSAEYVLSSDDEEETTDPGVEHTSGGDNSAYVSNSPV
jgi:hypothetical protein